MFASAEYYNYLAKISAHNTHAGYFSIDKKKHFVDSAQNKEGISDDESAYDLIMKDKERLLSFSNDVRFIFRTRLYAKDGIIRTSFRFVH